VEFNRSTRDKKPVVQATFKELTKRDKEVIAHSIESRNEDMILSRVVEDYTYGTTRALDYGDFHNTQKQGGLWEHAVNRNDDYFDVTELTAHDPVINLPRYLTFRTAGMYKNHESDRVENAVGLVFDAVLIDKVAKDMHVTTLFGVDKHKAPQIARDLDKYPERVAVSMGCNIKFATCTSCGKDIRDPKDICACLAYNRGGRRNGKKVAEFLREPSFFELSFVNVPAAVTAYVIDVLRAIVPGRLLKIASGEGGVSYNQLQVMASVYDMIKTANTPQDKQRLSSTLDKLIHDLEKSLGF
jgi:hypothetical protein